MHLLYYFKNTVHHHLLSFSHKNSLYKPFSEKLFPKQIVLQKSFPIQNVLQKSFPKQIVLQKSFPIQNVFQKSFPIQNVFQQRFSKQNVFQQRFSIQNDPKQNVHIRAVLIQTFPCQKFGCQKVQKRRQMAMQGIKYLVKNISVLPTVHCTVG